MDNNFQQTTSEMAIQRLVILTRILESDPEIIDSLADEDVSAELREMGIDPRPPFKLIELANAGATRTRADVADQVGRLFQSSKEEIFEEGMESNLTRGLSELIEERGSEVIAALTDLRHAEGSNSEIVAEALRWVGRIDHQSSYEARLTLLQRSLEDSSSRVRDAASVALAYLDDRRAVPAIRVAIARETYSELKMDLQHILSQLEEGP